MQRTHAAPPPTALRTGSCRPLCPVIDLNITELPEVVSPKRKAVTSAFHKHRSVRQDTASNRPMDVDLLSNTFPGQKHGRATRTAGLRELERRTQERKSEKPGSLEKHAEAQWMQIQRPGNAMHISAQSRTMSSSTEELRSGECDGWQDESFTTRTLRAPRDKGTEPCNIHAIQIRGHFILTLAPGSFRIWHLRLDAPGTSGLLFEIHPVLLLPFAYFGFLRVHRLPLHTLFSRSHTRTLPYPSPSLPSCDCRPNTPVMLC